MPHSYDQSNAMDVYPHRMGSKHARQARKIGEGNESAGVRLAIEVAHKILYEGATVEEMQQWVAARRTL